MQAIPARTTCQPMIGKCVSNPTCPAGHPSRFGQAPHHPQTDLDSCTASKALTINKGDAGSSAATDYAPCPNFDSTNAC